MSKFLSRKFLLAVGIILLLILDKKLNLGLDMDSAAIAKVIIGLGLAYIGVEGAADIIRANRGDKK